MITIQLTTTEAHAMSDVIRELAEPELILDPIDWEAVRTAIQKITNTENVEEFLLQQKELEQVA